MPPHLTTLPREIRDAILELCLVVGIINPYPAFYEDFNPFSESMCNPDTSLLAVNKAINAEAAEIFYDKNVWVINWSFKDEGPRKWVSQAPMDEIWHIYHNQIRHVSISFELGGLFYQISEFVKKQKYERLDRSKSLLVEACRWKLKICRELGFKSVTIDMTGCFHGAFFTTSEAIRRCCLEPLLDWVRNDEEIRVGEHNPASMRSYPKVTLTGWPKTIRAVRQGWEEQWGPLNHFANGDCHCLEGFFQPRDAKTIGKT